MARPSARVRRMHSTPMGPTGAAMEKPMIRPQRKVAESTGLGRFRGSPTLGRRLEGRVDGCGDVRLVRGGLKASDDLPALVDHDGVGRALESEAIGNAQARIEGGGIGGAVGLEEGARLFLGIVHLDGEQLDSALLVALVDPLGAGGLARARL